MYLDYNSLTDGITVWLLLHRVLNYEQAKLQLLYTTFHGDENEVYCTVFDSSISK